MADEIHLNDIGTKLQVLVKRDGVLYDVSVAAGNTTKQIKLRQKDGTLKTKTATYSDGGDGTDGILQYVTVDDDLDAVGAWEKMAYIEMGASPRFHTSVATFEVLPVLT